MAIFTSAAYAHTATVLGGFWPANGVSAMVGVGHGIARRRIAQWLGRKSTVDLRAIARALDGVVPGSLAQKTTPQVNSGNIGGSDISELGGGNRNISKTLNLVNRNTVAGDVTILNADLLSLSARTTFGTNPPANLDGNPLGTR